MTAVACSRQDGPGSRMAHPSTHTLTFMHPSMLRQAQLQQALEQSVPRRAAAPVQLLPPKEGLKVDDLVGDK